MATAACSLLYHGERTLGNYICHQSPCKVVVKDTGNVDLTLQAIMYSHLL
jgi:hypothetical protein